MVICSELIKMIITVLLVINPALLYCSPMGCRSNIDNGQLEQHLDEIHGSVKNLVPVEVEVHGKRAKDGARDLQREGNAPCLRMIWMK